MVGLRLLNTAFGIPFQELSPNQKRGRSRRLHTCKRRSELVQDDGAIMLTAFSGVFGTCVVVGLTVAEGDTSLCSHRRSTLVRGRRERSPADAIAIGPETMYQRLRRWSLRRRTCSILATAKYQVALPELRVPV